MNVQSVDTNTKPTVISTFAGCGGSSLGYKMAGYKELLAVEIDDHAVKIFKMNFPEVPVLQKDVSKLTGKQILDFCGIDKGELDVFDGSPPCQGFSTAGKRQVCDARNDLVGHYIRLVGELQPKVFIMENVSGMVKGVMKGTFIEYVKQMKALDYNVSCRLLNAKWLGVAQSRERMICIGVRQDIGVPVFPELQKKLITVKQMIGDLENIMKPEINHVWVDEQKKNTLNWRRALHAKQGEKYKPHRMRIYQNRPLPTITTGGMKIGVKFMLGNSSCHYLHTRALSIRELARCQSFPDDFKFDNDLVNSPGRIGNSVPSLMMKAISERIKDE